MQYLLMLLMLTLFLGCGDATKESAAPTSSVTIIAMVPDINYTVYKGDRLEKTTDSTQVSITKSVQDDTATVVLLEGSAQIIRAH